MKKILNTKTLYSDYIRQIVEDYKSKMNDGNVKKEKFSKSKFNKACSVLNDELDNIENSGILDENERGVIINEFVDFAKIITDDFDLLTGLVYVNMSVRKYLEYLIYCKEHKNDTLEDEIIIKDRIKYLQMTFLLFMRYLGSQGFNNTKITLNKDDRIVKAENFGVFKDTDEAIKVNNNLICDVYDSIEYDLDLEIMLYQFSGRSMINLTKDGYEL